MYVIFYMSGNIFGIVEDIDDFVNHYGWTILEGQPGHGTIMKDGRDHLSFGHTRMVNYKNTKKGG